jgi:GNAT superfamily N-acetyltransferase
MTTATQLRLFQTKQFTVVPVPGPQPDLVKDSVLVNVKGIMDLNDAEIEACVEMTLPRGRMRGQLEELRQAGAGSTRAFAVKNSRVILLLLEGEIVAWALVFYRRTHPGFEPNAYLFVREAFRRDGLGGILVRHARAIDSQVMFWPWDRTSNRFFRSFSSGLRIHPHSGYKSTVA